MFDWQYEDNMKIPPPNPLGQKKKRCTCHLEENISLIILECAKTGFPVTEYVASLMLKIETGLKNSQ